MINMCTLPCQPYDHTIQLTLVCAVARVKNGMNMLLYKTSSSSHTGHSNIPQEIGIHAVITAATKNLTLDHLQEVFPVLPVPFTKTLECKK